MSDFAVRQQDDRVSSWKTSVIAFLGLVAIFIALVAAWYLLPSEVRHPAAAAPPQPAPPQIGMLEQRMFESSNRGYEVKKRQLEVLGHFGWVDRSAGVARIPIDQAMDLVVERQRK